MAEKTPLTAVSLESLLLGVHQHQSILLDQFSNDPQKQRTYAIFFVIKNASRHYFNQDVSSVSRCAYELVYGSADIEQSIG